MGQKLKPLRYVVCLFIFHLLVGGEWPGMVKKNNRNVSSVNHQRLLNGARFGKRSKRKGSEVTMSIGASTPKPAKSYPRSETDAVIRGIVRLQVWVHCRI